MGSIKFAWVLIIIYIQSPVLQIKSLSTYNFRHWRLCCQSLREQCHVRGSRWRLRLCLWLGIHWQQVWNRWIAGLTKLIKLLWIKMKMIITLQMDWRTKVNSICLPLAISPGKKLCGGLKNYWENSNFNDWERLRRFPKLCGKESLTQVTSKVSGHFCGKNILSSILLQKQIIICLVVVKQLNQYSRVNFDNLKMSEVPRRWLLYPYDFSKSCLHR